MGVAVVVVTYNSEEHVAQLLDSIPAAMGATPYSVVVVDNGSRDGTRSLVSQRTDCVLVESTNRGYAAGVNLGIARSADASAYLILNPDATLDAGSVPAMLDVLRGHGAGIVAPRVREADGRLSPTLRRAPTLGRVGGLSFTGLPVFTERIEDSSAYDTVHVVDWAVGAILLIDARCYRTVGGLDETYFLYSEETDFSLRARDLGWTTVYTPDAGGMHVGGGSGESAMTHTMKIINRVRIYHRRAGTPLAWVYFSATVANELRRALTGHRRSWPTLHALLRPGRRPEVLGASHHLLPR
ncbi:glycosyltransferase family 2 protein [Nocardioides sp. STR2]|uniref:Glycosyltransferase family 2 protein n=1 Tax=Nocardioides pini TaxID=2975053 RepID=A0ABT4CDA9_9ACTN|nr:glycosyltransferase family 2 protein [Nocardioides pini]MCY4726947.1 glycosyltransferase family 2 protein [Nocardioides pini]